MTCKQYYECHITMVGDPETIKPHVLAQRWKFSAIDGDPTLGAGIKCYATRHFNIKKTEPWMINELIGTALKLEALGVKVIRRKIEKVIYDDRLETVKCAGGCKECHLDD